MNLNKFLAFVAIFIVLAIAGISTAFILKNGGLPKNRGENFSSLENPDYINVGKLRTTTKVNERGERSVLIFRVYLSYDKTNTELYEDINLSLYKIKPIFTEYFKDFTKEELLQKGEIKIKGELKSEVNKILVLGKIDDIFFEEMQYLD